MTKYMTYFALFVGVFYKMSNYEIYLPQLIEKLPKMRAKNSIYDVNLSLDDGEGCKYKGYLGFYLYGFFISFNSDHRIRIRPP